MRGCQQYVLDKNDVGLDEFLKSIVDATIIEEYSSLIAKDKS